MRTLRSVVQRIYLSAQTCLYGNCARSDQLQLFTDGTKVACRYPGTRNGQTFAPAS